MPAHLPYAGRPRLAAITLTLALAAAACGGGASAAPTSGPSLAPSPSPTPLDVAQAFLEIVGDPDFGATMEIEGTMEMGVSATLTGTMTSSGDDSRSLTKIVIAGTTFETESITSGGKSYSRSSPGPWLAATTSADGGSSKDDSLAVWMRRLSQIEDLGVVTKNGTKLHHLSAGDAPVPPGALGLDASAIKDPVVTIDFYAEDDGTPAVFAIEGTWIQLINGSDITVDFVMDMTITNIGSTIEIDPPDDVWTTYSSPLGYSMAHPDAFKVESRDGYDAYVGDGVDDLYVASWSDAAGLSPEGFRDGILASVKDAWGDPIAPPVANPLGGEPGYLATFQYTYDDGSQGIAFDALAMHDNVGWDVTLFSIPGQEVADFELFNQFLATFEYED